MIDNDWYLFNILNHTNLMSGWGEPPSWNHGPIDVGSPEGQGAWQSAASSVLKDGIQLEEVHHDIHDFILSWKLTARPLPIGYDENLEIDHPTSNWEGQAVPLCSVHIIWPYLTLVNNM